MGIGALRSELENQHKTMEFERIESSRLMARIKEAENSYKREIEENYRSTEKNDKYKEFELEIREL